MKIPIDLNAPLVGLDGKPLQPAQNAGPVLASMMVSQSKGNVLKMWAWALDFHQGKPVELDEADFKMLYDFVETSDAITLLGKAQILTRMIQAKEAVQTRV